MKNKNYYVPTNIKIRDGFIDYIETIEMWDRDIVNISKKTLDQTLSYLNIDECNRKELTKHKGEIYNHCKYAVDHLLNPVNKQKALNDLLADFDEWLYGWVDD